MFLNVPLTAAGAQTTELVRVPVSGPKKLVAISIVQQAGNITKDGTNYRILNITDSSANTVATINTSTANGVDWNADTFNAVTIDAKYELIKDGTLTAAFAHAGSGVASVDLMITFEFVSARESE